MKKILLFTLTIFFAINCSAQVEGNVTDSIGKSIADVTIIAMDSATQKIDSVKTDSEGFFGFKKLSAGNYRVTIKTKGYVDTVIKNVSVTGELKENQAGDISNAAWLEIVLKPKKTSN